MYLRACLDIMPIFLDGLMKGNMNQSQLKIKGIK